MRRVVSDTGPILHLSEAQRLDLLSLTGEVHVPQGVDAETAHHTTDWQVRRPAWLHVATLLPPFSEEAVAWQQGGLLGVGEAEAVALARQITANWLLTDDAAARLFARALGLEVHGSLGIVLWCAGAGHLTQADAEAAVDQLSESSLWISARVLGEVRVALDQIFRRH